MKICNRALSAAELNKSGSGVAVIDAWSKLATSRGLIKNRY